ncbi:vanin-like protein 1 [Ceratitis capitata]|uniref:vanin-like protein 1 n=1 Tax=Ceratitis capitata TaxID=7213 RepID=UPI00032972CD|nr:vanin-like protein 1 [Ceratitis capitata]
MRLKESFYYYYICYTLWIVAIRGEPTPANADYYIGAVVEFPALTVNGAASTLKRLGEFRRLLEDADIRPDIVVFPEGVLNDRRTAIVVPKPSEAVLPCDADEVYYDYIISRTSCYARTLSLYVLINVVEVENCTQTGDIENLIANCAIYNTNVVFDRSGTVISRYRKYNLFGSEWLYFNYTTQPEEEAIFHTDFNVTFGHFTCMDVLYARPAQALVQRGITDFLHPSKWQSELPFMTAVQLHQSWAYSNDVNLLVAGTNDPHNGCTGTGIYAGKYGTLIATMTSDEKQSKLHVSVVPKKYNTTVNTRVMEDFKLAQSETRVLEDDVLDRFTGVALARNDNIDLFFTQPLGVLGNESETLQQQLCHNDLCCNFYIERHANLVENVSTSSYYYRLAAFHGIGSFLNTEPEALAVCTLFACTGDHIYTCGRIYEENVPVVPSYTFDVIRITGNFTRKRPSLLLPTSVNSLLMPLAVDAFEWQVAEYSNVSVVNLTLVQSRADLLTFGIYANYFLDDTAYDHHNKDAAGGFVAAAWLIWLSLLMQVYS